MKYKLIVYLSQERLHELFEYREDNISRPLVWKIRVSNRVKIGNVAGSFRKSDGYYRVKIDRQDYQLHRLVWIYHNGNIPDEMQVDHIDRNPSNNLIGNLRLATKSQNNHNRAKQSNNTSGTVGVRIRKGIPIAEIAVNGKKIWLGAFKTIAEAEAARKEAEIKYFGDFARHE
jgi:hypothetical protein